MTAVDTAPFGLRTLTPRVENEMRRAPRRGLVPSVPRHDRPSAVRLRASVVEQPALKPRIVLRPMLGPSDGLDVTEAITRAVAQELWNLYGGNDVMNWLEAERLLSSFLDTRSAARGRVDDSRS